MQDNPKIGIFDSGIGGLSILTKLVELMPNISISYIADDLFFPYGEKSDHEIIERSSTIVKSLLEVGVDLIVVACNSATAGAIATLRERFDLPFVGVEPFLNLYNHQEFQDVKGPLVALTTEATGRSRKFKSLKDRLDPQNEITHYSFSNLASLIENIYYDGTGPLVISKIEEELLPLVNQGFTHAILGCTHYPFISDKIERFLDLICIDPAIYVAKRVKSLLAIYEQVENDSPLYQFMYSSDGKWQLLDSGLLCSVNRLIP